jgi:hypothetical protein
MKTWFAFVLLAALAMASATASAQTLYKLIDKKGKVTYVDTPPKDFDGQVIPVEIDTKRNSATINTPGLQPGARAFDEKQAAADRAAANVKAAQDKLDAARKTLASARDNPKEDEVERMGIKGGGTRPVFNESYEKRIAQLEEAVRKAEAELRQAQQAR